MEYTSKELGSFYHMVEPEATEIESGSQVCPNCGTQENQSASDKTCEMPLNMHSGLDDLNNVYHVVEKEENDSELTEHIQQDFYAELESPEFATHHKECPEDSCKSVAKEPSGIEFQNPNFGSIEGASRLVVNLYSKI